MTAAACICTTPLLLIISSPNAMQPNALEPPPSSGSYLVPGEDLAHWNDAAARLVEVSLLRNALTSNDAPYSYDALERCAVLKLSLNSSSCFKLFRIRKAVLNAVVVG